MNKRTLIILAVLAIGGIAYWWYSRKAKTTQPGGKPESDGTFEVGGPR